MAIIFSDVHGNTKKLHKALNYRPDELHVFAGDAVDSFIESPRSQECCLEELVASKCILIYGNHELSYHPARTMSCSGWHQYGADNFPQYLDDSRWKAAYAVDDYLITHAGLAAPYSGKFRTAKSMATELNKRFKNNSSTIYDVGRSRGGVHSSGGIFWYDFRCDWEKLTDKFNQVFGHCALQEPFDSSDCGVRHICINSEGRSDECWVFDTKEQRIVRL